MSKARAVTVIPATASFISASLPESQSRKRVAGYARVSTDHEEQLTSYEAQVDYYTNYIRSNPEWSYAGVYTDEGISATSTKNRDGFNRMVQDALHGKIDLIVTKSISRFARNTVDSLVTIRKLKEKGVEVCFEKENIRTMDSKGELLITIMSSLAQEESRSLSENVTWGQRKRFSDGKVSMPYGRFLGYEQGEDGTPQVNEEEAAIVRLIYSLFLDGSTPYTIAKYLTADGIPSPAGKDCWFPGTVKSILTNEKYKGDALLQKSYTVDFLSKKRKPNEGEIPQYYVENSHPGIISAEVFDMVQAEIQRRKASSNRHSGTGMFASRIICGECGGFYGAKVWHSTDQYRCTIYRCNNKFKGREKCKTPHLDEEEIKRLFVTAFNKLLVNKDEILANFESMKQMLFDTTDLDKEHAELQSKMRVITEMIQQCVDENAYVTQDQENYRQRYEVLVSRFETVKHRIAEIVDRLEGIKTRREKMEAFIDSLRKQSNIISDFDEQLWYCLVDSVTVYSRNDVRVAFKDGTVIQA